MLHSLGRPCAAQPSKAGKSRPGDFALFAVSALPVWTILCSSSWHGARMVGGKLSSQDELEEEIILTTLSSQVDDTKSLSHQHLTMGSHERFKTLQNAVERIKKT